MPTLSYQPPLATLRRLLDAAVHAADPVAIGTAWRTMLVLHADAVLASDVEKLCWTLARAGSVSVIRTVLGDLQRAKGVVPTVKVYEALMTAFVVAREEARRNKRAQEAEVSGAGRQRYGTQCRSQSLLAIL